MNWRMFLRRAWEFLYPPYELLRYGPTGDLEPEESTDTLFRGKKSVAQDVQQSHMAIAEAIYKSEIDRKKNIEDKAGNFLAGVGISSSILIALPAVLTEKINAPLYLKVMMLTIFMIAVGYLVVAAIYAVKVRARAPHYVLNSASLESFALTATDFRRQWALHLIDLARRNEPLLILKANQLYLAEKTFLRGVVAASVGGLLLGIFAIAYPKAQANPTGMMDAFGAQESAVLSSSIASCLNSNANLSLQLAAEGKAAGELKAELAANLKTVAALKAQLEGRKLVSQRNSSAQAYPAHPKKVSRKCSSSSKAEPIEGNPAAEKTSSPPS